MATTQEYLLGTITTLMTTELNALASSSGLTAGAISSVGGTSGVFSNVAGGGLGGYTMGRWELNLPAPSGAVAGAVYVWCVSIVDGTNYEDGSASIIPARRADVIFPLRSVTSTAQRIIVEAKLPPNSFKLLLAQNSGQAFAGTLNTLKVLPFTNQMV